MQWDKWPSNGLISGTIYTDGSGIHGRHPTAARAGWGFVSSREDGTCLNAAAYGPLPTFTQSVGCAEIFAAAMAIRHAEPFQSITIATDYARLVKGWERGVHAYTGPRSRCAEAWKHFWRAAIDYGISYISVRKVPAHRPYSDVTAGRVSFRDWYGNQQADAMARKGVAMHPSNSEAVRAEEGHIQAQKLQARYLAWVNASLQHHGTAAEWYQANPSEWWANLLQASEGCASPGGSGKAGFDRAPDPQCGDPPLLEACVSRNSLSEDATGPGVFRETLPQDGLASCQEHRDGVHETHIPYQTQHYTFCVLCGTYGKHLKKTKLRSPCPRAPRNRWASRAIDGLMKGTEPNGRVTGQMATPYKAD